MTPAERETAISLLKRRKEASGVEKMHLTGALQKLLVDNAEYLLGITPKENIKDASRHLPV